MVAMLDFGEVLLEEVEELISTTVGLFTVAGGCRGC